MTTAIDWLALQRVARDLLQHAYAPYSKFAVAAALLGEDGCIYGGVNVENASYGLTVCAERNAVARAVAQGVQRFAALALTCSGPTPVTPCGACRQVLAEFPPPFPLRSYARDGSDLALQTDALLPATFRLPPG